MNDDEFFSKAVVEKMSIPILMQSIRYETAYCPLSEDSDRKPTTIYSPSMVDTSKFEFVPTAKDEGVDEMPPRTEFSSMSAVMTVIAPSVASFDDAIPGLTERSTKLNSEKFAGYAIGDQLNVSFRVSSTSRVIASVVKVGKAPTIQAVQPAESQLPKTSSDWMDGVYFSPQAKKIFEVGHKIAVADGMFNLIIFGGSGYGKTSLAQAFAHHKNMKYARINCAAMRDPEEWFGYRELVSGDTQFIASELTEVIEAGNCVINFDEFNRVEPWLHNTLYPLLDSGKTKIHGKEIKIGPTVMFVATVNLGIEFTGTFELDTALKNRFGAKLPVGQLPEDRETDLLINRTTIDQANAKIVVKTMRKLRFNKEKLGFSFDASTRVSLQVAKFIVFGLTALEAFEFALTNELSASEAKAVIDEVQANLK